MRLNRFLALISLTSLFTLFLLFINNTGIFDQKPTIYRQLLNREEIENICYDSKLIPDKEPIFNNPEINLGGMSIPLVNLTIAENKGAFNLTQFILTGDVKYITSYITVKMLPYFVFFAFGCLCFLGISLHFITCCCPYWCCKRFDSDSIFACCSPCTSYTNLTFSVLSILACMVGFSFSAEFVSSLKTINCSLLDLYFNIVNGQRNQTGLPYWIGLNNIDSFFNNVSSNLTYISDKFPSLFNNTEFLENDPKIFTNQLINYFESFKYESLINPNPAPFSRNGINTIVPTYIKNYGPYDIQGSDLASIKADYDSSIMYAVEILTSLKTTSLLIANNIDNIKREMGYFRSVTNEVNKSVNNFTAKYLTPIVNLQNEIQNNSLTYFYLFFAIFMLLQILNIVGIILFGFYKFQRIRFLNHISWFIISILIVFSFIIGAVFCIIGVIGSDANLAVKYFLSSKSLLSNEILKDKQLTLILNICFNTNGDLGNNYLNIQNLYTGMINTIINSSSYVDTIDSKLKATSDSITFINDQYNKMKYDIMFTGDEEDTPNTAKDVLIFLESWTNSNKLPGPMIYCENPTQDQFVQNITKCYSDYTYLSSKNITNQRTNNKYNNFTNCPSNTTDFPNVANGISQYHLSLADYILQNTNLLNKLISANSNLSSLYSESTSKLKELTKNTSEKIIPIKELFSYINGDKSLFMGLNCSNEDLTLGFLAYDISNFVNNIGTEKLSKFSLNIGMVIIVVSFLNCITVVFSICMINHNIFSDNEYLDYQNNVANPLEIEFKQRELNPLN